MKIVILLMMGCVLLSGNTQGATKHSWDSLDYGGLKWDDEVGLFQNYGHGVQHGEQDRPVVHNARFNAGSILLAAEFGLLDDPRAEKAVRALQRLQEPDTGMFREHLEDTRVRDNNVAFFVCRILLVLKYNHSEQLTPQSRRIVDDMLNNSYQWFYKAAMKESYLYPNAYLGDLLCAKLVQEMGSHPLKEREALSQIMLKSADYWQQKGWGWGEHLSDPYAGVCIDMLSQYLLFTKDKKNPMYRRYYQLLKELLAIDDIYGEGPRVPAVRSYAFTTRKGGRTLYRDRIATFKAEPMQKNNFWREGELLYDAYFDAGWHECIEPPRGKVQRNIKIPCFGGITAWAIQEKDFRLGALSKFPIMPTAENHTWGLAWQSFPVAFWSPKGDWGFMQWETVEDGEVKAHPTHKMTGARALTSHVNPPVYGKTYSIQRGGDLLVVRIMPVIVQDWMNVTDGFKIADCTAKISEADSIFSQLLLKYPDRTVSLCAIPSISGCAPVRKQEDTFTYWKFDYTQNQLKSQKIIVDVWGISLNGEITHAPEIELGEYNDIPMVSGWQKRRLKWKWPKTSWDVVIDPMSDDPLTSK